MEIKTENKGKVLVVRLIGEVGHTEEDELLKMTDQWLEQGYSRILLNLAELEHANSALIGVFLRMLQIIQAGKARLCFSNVQPQVLNVMRITKLLSFLKVFTLEKDAVDHLSA